MPEAHTRANTRARTHTRSDPPTHRPVETNGPQAINETGLSAEQLELTDWSLGWQRPRGTFTQVTRREAVAETQTKVVKRWSN